MYNTKKLHDLYSGDDLENLFKGGFINFGYWIQDLFKNDPITEAEFINANKSLYKKVFEYLKPKETDDILEVGSGHGSGSALLYELHKIKSITGVDYLQKHVDISIQRNKSLIESNKLQNSSLKYIQGAVENLPIENSSIDKIYTVEAFQHFNVNEAISEFSRVLVNGGRLVITTVFALNKEKFPEILELLPRPAILSDNDNENNSALPEVLKTLKKYNFHNIKIESIGKNVWCGYDKWVRQYEPGILDTNWLMAYKKGLLDYFLISAEKS